MNAVTRMSRPKRVRTNQPNGVASPRIINKPLPGSIIARTDKSYDTGEAMAKTPNSIHSTGNYYYLADNTVKDKGLSIRSTKGVNHTNLANISKLPRAPSLTTGESFLDILKRVASRLSA